MCGIYGYIGPNADFDVIKNIAILAETRGSHAFGFSYFKTGKLLTFKSTGRVSKGIQQLERVEGSQCIIGYAGEWNANTLQPITEGSDSSMIFNDNCNTYKSLYRVRIKAYHKPDSVTLQKALLKSNTNPLPIHEHLSAYTVLAIRNKELFIMNRDLPFFIESINSGVIFCSRKMSENSECLINSFMRYVIK